MPQRFDKKRGSSGPSNRPGGKKPSGPSGGPARGGASGGKGRDDRQGSGVKRSSGKPGSFRSGPKRDDRGPRSERSDSKGASHGPWGERPDKRKSDQPRGERSGSKGAGRSPWGERPDKRKSDQPRSERSSGKGASRGPWGERPDNRKTERPRREPSTVKKTTPRTRKRFQITPETNLDLPAWLAKPGRGIEVSSTTIQDIFAHLELPEEHEKIGRLLDHLLLVRELNEEINLVSRANVGTVLLQSLWESLVPIRDLSWHVGGRILDLGTGGGFPGIPLAVMLPEDQFTLIDSRRAKTLALKNVVEDLKLTNVSVVHDRAETYSQHTGRAFDTVVVRAVGMLKEVAPWAAPLLCDGGTMLAWKGPEGIREFRELNNAEWSIAGNVPVLPHRSVMVLRYKVPE